MKNSLNCENNGYIDLHVHSTFSDGTLSPTEILSKASKIGLKAISITDHDTLDGCKLILKKTSIAKKINFITGVEISAHISNKFKINGSTHILGYGIDINNKKLNSHLKFVRESRRNRSKKIINKLIKMGIYINEKDINSEVTGNVIGRPHFANILIKKGFANSNFDAFNRFLGNGKPAYVEKYKIKINDIFAIIREAGGVPVLAHPFSLGISDVNEFEKLIKNLKNIGLMGIESIYPEHSKNLFNFYSTLANKYNLLITGGTDYHGKNSTNLNLGFGNGNFSVPFDVYNNLIKSIDKLKKHGSS